MRKRNHLPVLLLIAVAAVFFQGCVKDNCTGRYTYWTPVYKTRSEARANVKNNPSRPIERPGKIYTRGNYIFLNEVDKGVHIIDNSNPAAPRNMAFVDIPGNLDMAVKGNMLYADFYSDLVAIDITNPLAVVVTKFTENVFPERFWGQGFVANSDPNSVIVDWEPRDTVLKIDCGGSNGMFSTMKSSEFITFAQSTGGLNNAAASPFGMGGSMARFTIVGNYMYTVSQTSLNVVSISNPQQPAFNNRVSIGWGIETIYPFSDKLFIGSNSGMFVYSITNPTNPQQLSSFSHATSCDPVIADNNHAFVTLRSGTLCQGFSNQLDVLDITNITHPALKKTYQMVNPHGLSKDGNTLIICDGKAGLKFFDAADVNSITLLKNISGLETFDVITKNGWALVVAKDGLYQYDYSSLADIKLLSKLGINK